MAHTNQKFPSFRFQKEMASTLATLVTSKTSGINDIPGPITFDSGSQIVIGRGSTCDLAFPDIKSISHVHCYLRNTSGSIEIKCVSTNKTIVDGKQVAKDEWSSLADGSTILLSSDPKVKLELKIGETNRAAEKKRRNESKRRLNAIAEITAINNPNIKAYATPTSKHANDVTVTIGRAKDCDVMVDNKKISSVHCKLHFNRMEGESVRWSLTIVGGASKNKTYLDTELIDGEKLIASFSDPVKICLVFPSNEKPVETFIITPIMGANDRESPDGAGAREEKRQKKEIREFEKQNIQGDKEYNEEIRKLIEEENKLLHEIGHLETVIAQKRLAVATARADVEKKESEMQKKQEEFESAMTQLQSEHSRKLNSLTDSLNEIVTRLSQFTDEKLKLQLTSQRKDSD